MRAGRERGGGRTDTPIHRAILPAQIGVSAYLPPGSAYRRIGAFAPGSAYRRIGVFFPPDRHSGLSASGVPAYARIGVSQPRPPTVVSAYVPPPGHAPAYRRIGARRFCDTICRHADCCCYYLLLLSFGSSPSPPDRQPPRVVCLQAEANVEHVSYDWY